MSANFLIILLLLFGIIYFYDTICCIKEIANKLYSQTMTFNIQPKMHAAQCIANYSGEK